MTLEEKVNELEKALIKVDERSKSNKIRLDEVDAVIKEISNLIAAIRELAVETRYMRADLNETIRRLAKLESKDADKWDKFKWLIIAAAVVTVVGYLAIQVGLK